jgi:hypothetical protein
LSFTKDATLVMASREVGGYDGMLPSFSGII